MKVQEARELGQSIAMRARAGKITKAYALLAPVLAERTPFRLLDHIGGIVGAGELSGVNLFFGAGRRQTDDGGLGGHWECSGSATGS